MIEIQGWCKTRTFPNIIHYFFFKVKEKHTLKKEEKLGKIAEKNMIRTTNKIRTWTVDQIKVLYKCSVFQF